MLSQMRGRRCACRARSRSRRILKHVDHALCGILTRKQFVEFFTLRGNLGASFKHRLFKLMKSGFDVIGM